jgi:hypothetical protein
MHHRQNPLELPLLDFCTAPEKEFHVRISLYVYDYTILGYGKEGKGTLSVKQYAMETYGGMEV